MYKKSIIDQTKDYVREKLEGEGSGHDWWHVYRVWKNSIHIAKGEKVDLFVTELAALLHDIADWKFCDGDTSLGLKVVREWLEKLEVEENIIVSVCEIINDISFKGAGVDTTMKTKEGMVVQDADRLDAIGAIGVARVFAYGGHAAREIHNPNIKQQVHKTFEQYKNNKGTSINHFYEKLLLLKDLMNTEKAKEIACERDHFMRLYLEQFLDEWEGKK